MGSRPRALRPPQDNSPQALILAHQKHVVTIARRCHAQLPYWLELDDLIQQGQLGLIEAASKFDPSRGIPFKIYAFNRIRGSIIDAFRRRNYEWELHRQLEASPIDGDGSGIAEESGYSRTFVRAELADDDDPAAPIQHLQIKRLLRRVLVNIGRSPENRKYRIALRSYLDGKGLRELGEQLGVGESRACIIRQEAVERARAALGKRGLTKCDLLAG